VARGTHGAIIVGVDGSLDSTAALAWALRGAQIAGLAVCAVHAWLPDELDDAWSCYGQRVVRERAMTEDAARKRVHDSVAAAAALVPSGRSLIDKLMVRGDPGTVLAALSEDGAQLVVGATGSGALPGIVASTLGSTTRFVLRHAWCPVTVVPSARLRTEPPTAAVYPAIGAVPRARTPGGGS
jgi:nucleotide-binding universal stress UspA family protein